MGPSPTGPRSCSPHTRRALHSGAVRRPAHSHHPFRGGDSRRLCAYAAQGKIFVPLPADTDDGHPAALFDLVLKNLAGLPAPESGQVLIASGDVLLTFDPATVNFDRHGVTGVAYPGSIERGGRPGVYAADCDGRVLDFLQKPDEETAHNRHAVDAAGRVLVDTGLLSLDPATVECWLAAAGVRLRNRKLEARRGLLRDIVSGKSPALDLYEQYLMAMVPALDLASYLRAVAQPSMGDGVHRRRLERLYRALHGRPFFVDVLPYCEFFHIGSSRELLSNISMLNRTAHTYGFSNFHRPSVAERASLEGALVYNSILGSRQIATGGGVLLKGVHTDEPLKLAGRNIVVGYPKEAKIPLRLPEGKGLACLPVRSKRAVGPRPPQILMPTTGALCSLISTRTSRLQGSGMRDSGPSAPSTRSSGISLTRLSRFPASAWPSC